MIDRETLIVLDEQDGGLAQLLDQRIFLGSGHRMVLQIVEQLGAAENVGVCAEIDDQARVLAGERQEAAEAGCAHRRRCSSAARTWASFSSA